MRYLVSTFKQGDYERILQAMRSLPYDRLVLVGDGDIPESEDLQRISKLEEVSGHQVETEELDVADFMETVDEIADLLSARMKPDERGVKPSVALNISGGTKLLGDAALLAAFRVGVETYHVNGKITRIPVIKGATALDRFTDGQSRMVETIGGSSITLDELAREMHPASRQATERVIRELKKSGLIESGVQDAKVRIRLSGAGFEVHRAISQRRKGAR